MTQFRSAATLAMIALFAAVGFAQDPKVAIVDLQKAVTGSVEGKKGEDKFNARLEERRQEVVKLQKEMADNQNKLQTQQRALSESAVADLNRNIQKQQTELQRISEDAQAELDELRTSLLQPVMSVAQQQLTALAAEKGYTAVFDVSVEASDVVWFNPENDITDVLTDRINKATTTPAAK